MCSIIVHILSILFAIQHIIVARPSCTTKDCLEVRMPLLSNNLKAPLTADLDVSSMNQQLKEYIDDTINYTFSNKIEDVVDSKQDLLKMSMLIQYERNLNETKNTYNEQVHDIITGIEQKQDGFNLQIQNYSLQLNNSKYIFEKEVQSSFVTVDQQLANLKLAMFTEYVNDLQITKSVYEKKYAEFVRDLKSQFTDFSKGLREEFNMIKTKSENQYHEMIAWKYNITEQRVGFTACEGVMVSGSRIQFTSVKSSHGIVMASSYRNGKFIAPRAGYYLVFSNPLSKSQAGFYIRKNGNEKARAYSHWSDSNKTPFYSAPLSAFIELSVNDVITIEGENLDHSSCLTIVQL